MRSLTQNDLNQIFKNKVEIKGNFINLNSNSCFENQQHTNEVFTEKWNEFEANDDKQKLYEFQKLWYLKLYGFNNEEELATFLCSKDVILDAGCGLGYKAAWFAELAPDSLVLAMDFSEASEIAATNYTHIPNLLFVRGDIANTNLNDACIDYVSCDQVIMHTEDPTATFSEFCRIANTDTGEIACYFYAKKALPRELLDEFFRTKCKELSSQELWDMSQKLTKLGKDLTELDIEIDIPDIPQLGIKGGKQDLQRFIYWNFIKCFWNPDLGHATSVSVNFDWYSPSNALRFNKEEVFKLVNDNGLSIIHFHTEEAAYSGRFAK